jgi:hypothetical protein
MKPKAELKTISGNHREIEDTFSLFRPAGK